MERSKIRGRNRATRLPVLAASCNTTRTRGWQVANTPRLRQCAIEKIFSFAPDPNQLHIPPRLVPPEGRSRVVTNAGRDAVDARASGAQLAIAGRDEPRERSAACRMIGAFCVR